MGTRVPSRGSSRSVRYGPGEFRPDAPGSPDDIGARGAGVKGRVARPADAGLRRAAFTDERAPISLLFWPSEPGALTLKKPLFALGAVGAVLVSASAQETAPAVTPSVRGMRLEAGALTGPGAELILAELPRAQFILVGEDHGFADPPELALAIAKAARPFGVVSHAAEIGPLTDEWIEARLGEGGPDALGGAIEGRPLAVPFLTMREDALLADYFLKNAPRRRDVLWGVDQEFIGATLIWLERLEALAKNDAARKLAGDAIAAERAAFAKGDFGAMFMFTATPETFASLRGALAGDKERPQSSARWTRAPLSIAPITRAKTMRATRTASPISGANSCASTARRKVRRRARL